MARKKRDYKAEYKRRLARAKVLGISKSVARGHPKKGEKPLGRRTTRKDIEDVVAKDAKRVFGKKPKRTKEEQFPIDYEIKLADLKRRDGRFEWTDEASFVGTLQALGMTAHDAYTLWFSP